MHSLYLIAQAIRYELIPYVPFISKRGHETTWPESYDFVGDPKYWKLGWRDDPTYCGLQDRAETVFQLSEWMCDHDEILPNSFDDRPSTYSSLPGAASADKFVMAAIAGRAATASKRAVHKDAIDPVYDELHTRVLNEIQRATAFWSKKNAVQRRN